ncbi:MAG: DinB family protein [Chloroflexi bacterium]|nr:DinB family protein [Chloroflexota bacterium]
MVSKTFVIQSFRRNSWVAREQAKGLSHEDTLLQLPFRSNCFNWVLGHIVVNRDNVLAALGEPAFLTEQEQERYTRGSDPIDGVETAVSLSHLLDGIQDTQTRIRTALENASPETLASIYNEEHNQTLADQIAFLNWHEAYHVGQLEILRQLAGTDDSIIS